MIKTLHSLFPRNCVRYRKSNWNSARSYSSLVLQTGKSQTVSDVDYKMKPVNSFIHIWSVKWLNSEDLQETETMKTVAALLIFVSLAIVAIEGKIVFAFFKHFTISAQSVASLFQNNHYHNLFISSSREARAWNPKMFMSWGWFQNGEAKADRESWNSPY